MDINHYLVICEAGFNYIVEPVVMFIATTSEEKAVLYAKTQLAEDQYNSSDYIICVYELPTNKVGVLFSQRVF